MIKLNSDTIKLGILLLLILILFWPTLEGMYDTWITNSNNSHGLLVPMIVAYLGWDILTKRSMAMQHALSREKQGARLGLIALISVLVFYFVSTMIDIVVFKNLAFVLCVQSVVLFVFGWFVFRLFIFPLFFLFFMVPVPVTLYGMVALPMQLFATKITVALLQLTPLPISADGNVIRIGSEMLEVAEACSGLRSLMAFIMLSLLFAYLAKIRFWKKAIMVGASVPIAICGNIARLIVTSFIAYIYGARIASGFIHDASGYIMFVLAFLIFFWLGRKLEGQAIQNTNPHE